MSEDFNKTADKKKPNRNRKIRAIGDVLELQGVAHPKFGELQSWYIEKNESDVVNAIVIDETSEHGRKYHGVKVVLPHDAPVTSIKMPGIAAALGLAEMVSNIHRKQLPPMNDLVHRISSCSYKEQPFQKSSKWAPLIVSNEIDRLSCHPSWNIVCSWDDALKGKMSLSQYLARNSGDESLETVRTRLRHLCLPATQKNYNLHKVKVFGIENLKPRVIFVKTLRIDVFDYTGG